MKKSIRLNWISGIAILMGVVAVLTFIGGITDGFTKEWEDVTLRERNDKNLLTGDYGWNDNTYNEGDGIVLSSKKDGSVIVKGEYKGSGENVVITLESLNLSAGTYTLSGAPKGGSYTYHLRVVDESNNVLAVGDFGSTKGSFTLSAPGTVKLQLVCFSDNVFESIKLQPVLVEGTESGDFYE